MQILPLPLQKCETEAQKEPVPVLSPRSGHRVLGPQLGRKGKEIATHNLGVWSFLGGGRQHG